MGKTDLAPFGALIMNDKDNVATSNMDIPKGTLVKTVQAERILETVMLNKIVAGHKFALCDICAGSYIIKYGEIIGVALKEIKAGECVHIHNVESQRGRGDKLP